MPISLVASTNAAPGANGGTTGAIDTTGANLLAVSIAWNALNSNTIFLTDSKGNSWTPLSPAVQSPKQQWFYVLGNPLVGPGHTVSVVGAIAGAQPVIHVYAFAGVSAYQAESTNLAGGAGPISCGSLTPSVNGALVLAGLAANLAGVESITPAGFTLAQIQYVSGVNYEGAAAWQIQATAAPINPTWAWTGSHNATSVSAAVFLPFTGVSAAVRTTQDAVELLSLPAAPPLRVTQDAVELLSLPTPALRVTQDAIEILSSGPALAGTPSISQLLVETLTSQTFVIPPAARVTQVVAETLTANPHSEARASQLLVETLTRVPPSPVRVSQAPVELFSGLTDPATRLSQAPVETVQAFAPALVEPRVSQAPLETVQAFAPPLVGARVSQAALEILYPFGCYVPRCTSGEFLVDLVTPGGSCPGSLLP